MYTYITEYNDNDNETFGALARAILRDLEHPTFEMRAWPRAYGFQTLWVVPRVARGESYLVSWPYDWG